jgi:hypothetical protein
MTPQSLVPQAFPVGEIKQIGVGSSSKAAASAAL